MASSQKSTDSGPEAGYCQMASSQKSTDSGSEALMFENDFRNSYKRYIERCSLAESIGMAWHLHSENKISADEFEMIMARGYRGQRALKLCHLISTKGQISEYKGLQTVLGKKPEYAPDDLQMSSEIWLTIERAFQKNFIEVVSTLSSETALACASSLLSKGIISTAELQSIQAEITATGKAVMLYKILLNKGATGISVFVIELYNADRGTSVTAKEIQRAAIELALGKWPECVLEQYTETQTTMEESLKEFVNSQFKVLEDLGRRGYLTVEELADLERTSYLEIPAKLMQFAKDKGKIFAEALSASIREIKEDLRKPCQETAESSYLSSNLTDATPTVHNLDELQGNEDNQASFKRLVPSATEKSSPCESPTLADKAATKEDLKEVLATLNMDQLTETVAFLHGQGFLTVSELKELMKLDDAKTSAELLLKFSKEREENFAQSLMTAAHCFINGGQLMEVHRKLFGQSKSTVSTATTSSQTDLQSSTPKLEHPRERVQLAVSRFRDALVRGLTLSDVAEILNGNLKKTLSVPEMDEIKAKSSAKEAVTCLLDIVLKRTDLCYDFYAALPQMAYGLVTFAVNDSSGEEALKKCEKHELGGKQMEATYDCDECDVIPDEAVKELLRAIPDLINRIKDANGRFSYSFGKNMELTVYVGGNSTAATSLLETELKEFLRAHIPERFVKVFIENRSFDTKFCTRFLGSTISFGNFVQTVGLYLQYETDQTIYWVSCAHLLNSSCDITTSRPLNAEFSSSMFKKGNPGLKVCIKRSNGEDYWIEPSTPYIYLNYNSQPLSNGDPLDHAVDIMIGSVPFTKCHLSKPFEFLMDPPMRFIPMPVFHLDREGSKFNLNKLNGRKVYALTRKATSMTDCELHYGTVDGNIDSDQSRNMLKIKPCEKDSGPAYGHSGSVWFLFRNEDNWEQGALALAMTCLIHGEGPSGFWLASPLSASLLALSKEYPEKFPSHELFSIVHWWWQ